MNSASRAFVLSLAAAWCAAASATPALRCELDYADRQYVLRFPAGIHPYDAAAVEVAQRFRFKAVLRDAAAGLSSVRIYVYGESDSGSGWHMLQELRYEAPFPPQDRPGALTGDQTIYTLPKGRSLRYACALEGLP